MDAERTLMEYARECVTTAEAPIKTYDEVCALVPGVKHQEFLQYLHQAEEILIFKHSKRMCEYRP